MTQKLRGATNLFIVSLAWADLMLGIIVLPTSAMYEVFHIWIFGVHWCAIWLAVDVWMCTASILHLVVISLDRYIAVTHPVTYPNIMSSKRAKLLILGAWVLSFVICFPPLVGWNEDEDLFDENKSEDNSCMPECKLIQEPGYVIYSAVGSFYAPMLVMIFFNYKIYRTATKTTKAIRKGWTKIKVGQEEMGMGIHRGGGTPSSSNRLSAVSKRYSSSTPYINGIKRDRFDGILMEEETAKLLLAVSKNHGKDKLLSVQYTTTKRCAHGNHKTFVECGTQTGEEAPTAKPEEQKRKNSKVPRNCCFWRWKKSQLEASSKKNRQNSNTLLDWSDIDQDIPTTSNTPVNFEKYPLLY
ncbi:Oamb [Lepeophtheirus salmonis]|uniref:Oamb n=1 Tax=Lepeophtheirus salmonis TaxID=72036 RepID=A0A7R8CJP9_LEPSM|nr:Oamb [Lepeophtheirus salmonis]CAF2840651.1 Oamb [Lepeophtheirus salmonis]